MSLVMVKIEELKFYSFKLFFSHICFITRGMVR